MEIKPAAASISVAFIQRFFDAEKHTCIYSAAIWMLAGEQLLFLGCHDDVPEIGGERLCWFNIDADADDLSNASDSCKAAIAGMANAANSLGRPAGAAVCGSGKTCRQNTEAGQSMAGGEAPGGKFLLALGHGTSDAYGL
jgi:hypothetical protein